MALKENFIDALPDKAWRNYVNKVRIELENEFRYPKDLPRDKIRILTQRLANLLQEFERSYNAGLVPDKPGYQTAFCSGVIGNSEDDVRVVVDSTPSGAFTVTCESSPKKPASSQ